MAFLPQDSRFMTRRWRDPWLPPQAQAPQAPPSPQGQPVMAEPSPLAQTMAGMGGGQPQDPPNTPNTCLLYTSPSPRDS